jgi:hypothetical protein
MSAGTPVRDGKASDPGADHAIDRNRCPAHRSPSLPLTLRKGQSTMQTYTICLMIALLDIEEMTADLWEHWENCVGKGRCE